jgi:hypothetical protein
MAHIGVGCASRYPETLYHRFVQSHTAYPNTELVEMGVGPPHGNLEDVVQIGDGALTAVPITGEICLATATESPPAP